MKEAAGFVCVPVEVGVLVSSFFPKVNSDAEENGLVLPGVGLGFEVSTVLEGFKVSEATEKRDVDFALSAVESDGDLFSVASLNIGVAFDLSTAPPNTRAGLAVSAEPLSVNVGFEPPAELPKIEGGFEPPMLPPNIDVGLGESAGLPNVNVGLPSVELPPTVDTGLEPPRAPPNKDAGLDPSADVESELVPPNEKTGALPEAGRAAGVEEIVLLKVVALAGVSVGLGGVDVEGSLPAATDFPKRFVTGAEGKLNAELPNADPNLAGSFEPAAPPKADIGTVDFFGSSATGTTGAASVAPGGT